MSCTDKRILLQCQPKEPKALPTWRSKWLLSSIRKPCAEGIRETPPVNVFQKKHIKTKITSSMGLQICFQKKRQVVAVFFDTYYTSTMCIGFFWDQKNKQSRFPHLAACNLWCGSYLNHPERSSPCPFLTQKVSQGVALGAERSDPSKKKKQIAKSGFCEHKKLPTIFVPQKFWGTPEKKKKTPTNLQQPNPKPQDLPKNLQTKVLSNPNICFPTTPFVPNFRRRSAVFLRRSAKGSSAPAWKKVVLASSTWGIGTSRLDYLNKLGKTVGKSRERCRFSFIKE